MNLTFEWFANNLNDNIYCVVTKYVYSLSFSLSVYLSFPLCMYSFNLNVHSW